LPDNWFGRIQDIIRTRFVAKYIDGVDFLIEYIKLYCDQCDLYPDVNFEARDEGYYAAHLYVKQKFEIPAPTWDTETIDVSIEIQIMTQLQEVIITLLHKYYENSRKKINKEEKWQWNYKSDEFAANYLGHILHYVEGMIVEIRDKDQRD
jgi:ppGpp synthetase/RelA/SpoT-type nucleotidyltranferase